MHTKKYRTGISFRTIIRYILFQLPELLLIFIAMQYLQYSFSITDFVKWTVILLWIIKDALLFPFLWIYYCNDEKGTVHTMIGKEGITNEPLDPAGYIHIGGELWKAETAENYPFINKGEKVIVVGRTGLKLIVVQADRSSE